MQIGCGRTHKKLLQQLPLGYGNGGRGQRNLLSFQSSVLLQIFQ